MSLVPSLYSKYITKKSNKLLEINPQWKWCPANQCRLVVKVTIPPASSLVNNGHVTSAKPVPIMCGCGTMWCFKCLQDAHWPATCKDAQVFREKNKGYAKTIRNGLARNAPSILSVQVKKCPSCLYPIEKGLGCPHMVCGLCNKEFCWNCLGIWDCRHHCKSTVQKRDVALPVCTKHLRTYQHFAVTHRLARSSKGICKTLKALDKVDKHMEICGKLPLKNNEWKSRKGHCKTSLTLPQRGNCASVQDICEVCSFYFHALLALEGLAILLSFNKDSTDKRLVLTFQRLDFITEKISGLLDNLCYEKDRVERLKHLVKCGKECFITIRRLKK